MKKLFLISALMLTVFCGKVSAGNVVYVTLSNGFVAPIDTDIYSTQALFEERVRFFENATSGWGYDNPYTSPNPIFTDDYDDNPFN